MAVTDEATEPNGPAGAGDGDDGVEPGDTGDASEATRRLRTIIIADVVLAGTAGLFTVSMYVAVARITTLLVVGLFVIAIAGLIATSLLPLRRGDTYGALMRLSIANWLVAIGSTVIATFQWPIQVQVALLPMVLAATFVNRERLGPFVVLSVLTAVAVAALGLLQDVTGLSDSVPTWLKTAVLLVTAPPFAALIVLVTVQHNRRISAMLDDERTIRRRLAVQTDELRRSRARVVAATDRERRRIERDLHDGAQSRLVAINLKLASARAALPAELSHIDEALDGVRREVHLAHGELRDLAHGLYPTVLTQHGLAAAISAAADRSPAPIRLDLGDVGRLSADVEAAIYFSVLEAIQNAAKHAGAARVDVRIDRRDDAVTFTVADDGVGFTDTRSEGQGLTNLRDRLGAIGGDLRIVSERGAGSTITGTIPLAGSR